MHYLQIIGRKTKIERGFSYSNSESATDKQSHDSTIFPRCFIQSIYYDADVIIKTTNSKQNIEQKFTDATVEAIIKKKKTLHFNP